ncbi:hypothetical protein Tco_0988994 [Tanacetum coccineum]|uniref:RNase H type-1 domain-containing protein n=1 Tax=Tanacetum coccineum TaxID=301880 RepID=A0ABQ5ETH9_9ASTR
MIKQYLDKTKEILKSLNRYSMEHVRQDHNKKADALSKLALMTFSQLAKEVLVEVLPEKPIVQKEVANIIKEEGETESCFLELVEIAFLCHCLLTSSLIPRSLNLFLVCLCRLCHLAILCLDQHAHTLHHLESLLTISLDRLDILKEDLVYQSLQKSLSLILKLS